MKKQHNHFELTTKQYEDFIKALDRPAKVIPSLQKHTTGVIAFFVAFWRFIWLLPYVLLLRPFSVSFIFMAHFDKDRALRLWKDME